MHDEWAVGAVTVRRVVENVLPVEATWLYPDITAAQLDPHRSWLCPHHVTDEGHVLLSIHTFVVESEGRTIVVDTCVGPHRSRLTGRAEFVDELDAAIDGGLAAVDVVLCTHLHYDHVGWHTREVDGGRVPTFPNARYLVSRRELATLDGGDHQRMGPLVLDPVIAAGLLDVVDEDHEVTGEVRLVPTPGHTPGHVAVMLASHGAHGIIIGDLAHSPLQFAVPELAAGFDWDPAMAATTRRGLAARLADTGVVVFGTHFARPTAGVLATVDGVVRFVGTG
jgi:glyoxylase-like metal-dependent hydrolase (beta-lactamase superfamily II)